MQRSRIKQVAWVQRTQQPSKFIQEGIRHQLSLSSNARRVIRTQRLLMLDTWREIMQLQIRIKPVQLLRWDRAVPAKGRHRADCTRRSLALIQQIKVREALILLARGARISMERRPALPPLKIVALLVLMFESTPSSARRKFQL